jgi:glutamate N-acetyltransferase / amino-acid N-acetyltransferase
MTTTLTLEGADQRSPGVTASAGFRASGVTAGLKASGRPDLALVLNDGPLQVGAAVFTSNRVVGHPVTWSRQVVADGVVSAVVLNSGGANVCTGPEGFADVHRTAETVGASLGISPGDVVVCSTGLIGQRLAIDPLISGLEQARDALSITGGPDAAAAIMTTDSFAKTADMTVPGDDGIWHVGGMAKGAGMLAPGLATMLCVITTDAVVDAATADAALRSATSQTFDRIDSDGCMSTSDTVVLMASGASGVAPEPSGFAAAVTAVAAQLARQLVADAEGATHDIAITVARAIARSNLFKAAIYGNDPNWGRILAAVGTVPEDVAAFDPEALDVSVNGVMVCRAGGAHAPRTEVQLEGQREVHVLVDLHAGDEVVTLWTNDLTHGYVSENSEYST